MCFCTFVCELRYYHYPKRALVVNGFPFVMALLFFLDLLLFVFYFCPTIVLLIESNLGLFLYD